MKKANNDNDQKTVLKFLFRGIGLPIWKGNWAFSFGTTLFADYPYQGKECRL